METKEENKFSESEEKSEMSLEIEKTSYTQEEEPKLFQIVEFKINEDETWICEKHKAQKIFYCIEHCLPFCPNCLKDHKDCFAKDQVLEVDGIGGMLKSRCQIYMNLVSKYRDSILALKKDCERFNTSMTSTKAEHEKLYFFMQSKMKSLSEEKMKSTCSADQQLIDSGSGLIKDIDQIILEYDECIANYNKIQDNVSTKENTLKDLILYYKECKTSSVELLDSKQDSIRDKIDALKNGVEFSEGQSNIASAGQHIESAFRKIHSEGVSIISQQTGQGYLFNLASLSSRVLLFDIESKIMHRKELQIAGKPYRVPYGSGTVFYESKIILTGGMTDLATHSSDTYEYVLLTYSLAKRNSMICARSEHAVIIHSGQMYCVGGRGERGYLNSCERCAVDTQSFSTAQINTFIREKKLYQHLYKYESIPELNEAKSFISLSLFHISGKASFLYAFGGMTESQCTNSVERLTLSPILEYWEQLGTISHLRLHSMGSIQYSKLGASGILLFGGVFDGGEKSKDCYLYDPSKKDSIQPVVDWALPKEEDFYFKPLLPSARSNALYLVCHFQLYCMDFSAKKPEWIPVEMQRYSH